MPGVYGEQLAAFPELMRWHEVFQMSALPGGGFGPRKLYKRVRAYLTRNIGGDAGSPDSTFTGFDKAQFFVFNPIPNTVIQQGAYVEDPDTGVLYKFTQDNTYAREGGFAEHRLLSVEGPTDMQVPNEIAEGNLINGF